jgi:uncharacterized membrane protein
VTTSPEPRSLLSKFVTACVLFLVAVVALTLAFDLLTRIWYWLVLIAGLVGVVAVVIWIVRRRQNHW